MKIKLFLLLLFIFITNFYLAHAQEPECIFCTQSIPECGPNEELVNQTCEKCAYCKPIESCQKCTIHAQCPFKHKCTDGCCTKKPPRRIPEVVLKKHEKTVIHSDDLPIQELIKKEESKNTDCKTKCGRQCCKTDEKCIAIDQCKGKKGKCNLPTLRYCSKKSLDKLYGSMN